MKPPHHQFNQGDQPVVSHASCEHSGPLCLVTAARLPVALRLVRLLVSAGYRVIAADNLLFTACSALGKSVRYVRLPNLRRDNPLWIKAVIHCCQEFQVDYLLPVFEETQLIAECRYEIEAACPGIRIFSADAATMSLLRDKRRLAELCVQVGVKSPDWLEMPSPAAPQLPAMGAWPHGSVLKPAMGYAGDGVILQPEPRQLSEAMAARPGCIWMLQEFIPGATICLHAVAYQGTILAMVLYQLKAAFGPGERGGVGFGCVFEPIIDAAVSDAAAKIISATRYTGHIGFDMIRYQDEVYCVDANPRATAGLHLLEFRPGWLERFWAGMPLDAAIDSPCRDVTLLLPLALRNPSRLLETFKATLHYRDVAHRRTEPAASLLLLLVYAYIQLASWLQKEHTSLVITSDFSYP